MTIFILQKLVKFHCSLVPQTDPITGASEMAKQVRAPATKPGDLSSIPWTPWQEERADF